jgi:hypothetical protein
VTLRASAIARFMSTQQHRSLARGYVFVGVHMPNDNVVALQNRVGSYDIVVKFQQIKATHYWDIIPM